MGDSSSSSDDDSDDDFLTINKKHDHSTGGGGGASASADREALVRKKLLESFYGKSAVAQAKPTELERENDDDDDAEDDDDDDDDIFRKRSGARKSSRNVARADSDDDDDEMAAANLDSPRFDAAAHTRQHVWHSNVHSLLETEERLALQVRTLDSTMQTLVYENYSRFIDATDAIKSIGVNVQANEHGLHQLTTRLQAIDCISKRMEEDSGLGALRDQVAEKIRIQRLLTRLDALLKLPKTLHQHIAAGKYRTATKSYLSASSILGQHSQGFESLRTIETECTAILKDMKKTLVQKLLHWSGRCRLMSSANDNNEGVMMTGNNNIDGQDDDDVDDDDDDEENENLLPKTMTEIFECSGTLCILLDETLEDQQQQQQQDSSASSEVGLPELDADDLQSIAVAAASRALDRILDTHMIQVQERRFSTPAVDIDISNRSLSAAVGLDRSDSQHSRGTTTGGGATTAAVGGHGGGNKGVALIPRDYLDALVQVATLYGMSFGSKAKPGYLTDFISEAFSSFLSHVEAILLEESALLATREEEEDEMIDKNVNEINNNNMEEMSTKTGDLSTGYYYEEISGALAILVMLVRETASGLAMSEVGMSHDYASSLVDRAVQLTDSMVRLRVDQKFYELRRKIVQSCLKPFCASAAALQIDAKQKSLSQQPQQGSSSSSLFLLPEIIPVARSTLSDCLQLVDDTIRSILSTGLENQEGGGGAAQDLPILKDAVRASTRRFAAWLANALEILAGGESSNSKRLVEAAVVVDDDNVGRARSREDFGYDMPEDQDEYLMDLVDAAKKLLLVGDGKVSVDEESLDDVRSVNSDFILALSEMCRLAERSVSENLEQSIATHLGSGGKKKSRGMFPSAGDNVLSKNAKFGKNQDEIGRRFSLAASRVLALYAVNRGEEAARSLCSDLADLYEDGNQQPESPRAATYKALQIVKSVSLECADIFGCPKRAGPLPKMDDSNSLLGRGLTAPGSMRKTSLQLSVESIFKEKVPIFPHPLEELEASRNTVIFLVLKVAFRALLEHARMHTFSASGYQQIQLDTEFLKHMLLHYIDRDYESKGNNACISLSNLLADVMVSARDRCTEGDMVRENEAELLFESRSALGSFLHNVVARNPEIGDLFIIRED